MELKKITLVLIDAFDEVTSEQGKSTKHKCGGKCGKLTAEQKAAYVKRVADKFFFGVDKADEQPTTKSHPHADIIRLYADLAQLTETPEDYLECRTNESNAWSDISAVHWRTDFQYRIKPEGYALLGIEPPTPEKQWHENITEPVACWVDNGNLRMIVKYSGHSFIDTFNETWKEAMPLTDKELVQLGVVRNR